jgi:hypothetical protein
VDVKLLFLDGCPNWKVADERLRDPRFANALGERARPVRRLGCARRTVLSGISNRRGAGWRTHCRAAAHGAALRVPVLGG